MLDSGAAPAAKKDDFKIYKTKQKNGCNQKVLRTFCKSDIPI